MTDYKQLITRMADELDHYRQLLMDNRSEARAALAEPEPEDQCGKAVWHFSAQSNLIKRSPSMTTRSDLQRILSEMPEIESVSVVGDYSLIATVVSSSFREQDEAIRQEKVWKHLSDMLGPDELGNVEFIFTSTPEENAAVSSPSSVA